MQYTLHIEVSTGNQYNIICQLLQQYSTEYAYYNNTFVIKDTDIRVIALLATEIERLSHYEH